MRVEPSLNRAVAFAHALGMVKIDKGTSILLTDKGAGVAQAIVEQGETLAEEAKFLSEVAPRMTDALMKRVWSLEDLI